MLERIEDESLPVIDLVGNKTMQGLKKIADESTMTSLKIRPEVPQSIISERELIAMSNPAPSR